MAYLVEDHYYHQTEVPSGVIGAILMSLLEESQVECCDDERLQSLIQSLQAEIDHNPIAIEIGHGLSDDQLNLDSYQEESLLSEDKQVNSCIDSSLWEGVERNWNEMEIQMSSSSPCDDMISWYLGNGSDHMDDLVEFEEFKDYSQMCPRVPSEENVCTSLLWHESYESVMHG